MSRFTSFMPVFSCSDSSKSQSSTQYCTVGSNIRDFNSSSCDLNPTSRNLSPTSRNPYSSSRNLIPFLRDFYPSSRDLSPSSRKDDLIVDEDAPSSPTISRKFMKMTQYNR